MTNWNQQVVVAGDERNRNCSVNNEAEKSFHFFEKNS